MSPRTRYRVTVFGGLLLQILDGQATPARWRDATPVDFAFGPKPIEPSLLFAAAGAILEPDSLRPTERLSLAADLEQVGGGEA